MSILTNRYAYAPLAALREYAINARDYHVAAGTVPAVSAPAASRPKAHRVVMRMCLGVPSGVKPSDRLSGEGGLGS